MNNKLTTPKAILIGSFMIAGTILYTSWNISNPFIGTAQASWHEPKMLTILQLQLTELENISRILMHKL